MGRGLLNITIGLVLDANFGRAIKDAERRLRSFAGAASSIGRDLTLGVSAPLAALAGTSLQAAVEFDRLEQALISISGSSESASAQLARLRDLAELPGISFEQATETSLQLQGLGFSAERAEETIRQVGNAIATVGGTQLQFEGVIRQLAQIEGKNKILQEDVRILIENAPILGKILKDTFGSATAEGIREVTESGEEFVDIVINQLGELPRVSSGLANSFENLGIAAKFALANIGLEINRVFQVDKIFQQLSDTLNFAVDVFKALDDETKRQLVNFTAFVAAIGPATFVVGRLASGVANTIGVFKNLTDAVAKAILGLLRYNKTATVTAETGKVVTASVRGLALALGGLGIGLLVFKFIELISAVKETKQSLEETETATQALAAAERQAQTDTENRLRQVEALIDIAQDETRAEDDRIRAIRQLKSEYPDYFANVSEDLTKTGQLEVAKNKLKDAILAEARARALSSKAQEIYNKQLELEEELATAQRQEQEAINKVRERGFTGKGGIQQATAELQKQLDLANKAVGPNNKNADAAALQAAALQGVVFQYQEAAKRAVELQGQINQLVLKQEELASLAAENTVASGDTSRTPTPPPSTTTPEDVKILEKYQEKIRELRKENELLGFSLTDLREKEIETTQKALIDLAGKGFGANSQAVRALTGRLEELNDLPDTVAPIVTLLPTLDGLDTDKNKKEILKEEREDIEDTKDAIEQLRESTKKWRAEVSEDIEAEALETAQRQFRGLLEIMEPLRAGIDGFFDALFDRDPDTKPFENAIESMIKAVGNLIKQIIAAIVVASILTFLLGAGGVGLGGSKLTGFLTNGGEFSLFGGLLRKIGGVPFLADGGIVTRPTLSVIGEGGPEAVIPLKQLGQFQGGPVEVTGTFLLEGNNLVAAVERNQYNRSRTRGR